MKQSISSLRFFNHVGARQLSLILTPLATKAVLSVAGSPGHSSDTRARKASTAQSWAIREVIPPSPSPQPPTHLRGGQAAQRQLQEQSSRFGDCHDTCHRDPGWGPPRPAPQQPKPYHECLSPVLQRLSINPQQPKVQVAPVGPIALKPHTFTHINLPNHLFPQPFNLTQKMGCWIYIRLSTSLHSLVNITLRQFSFNFLTKLYIKVLR